MADATRTVTPLGMVYLPGRVHPFPAGQPLDLPHDVAAALDAAGHLAAPPASPEAASAAGPAAEALAEPPPA